MFLRSLRVGQSPLSNAMGDDILSFFETIPNGSQKLEDILVRSLHDYHYLQKLDRPSSKATSVEPSNFR